MPLSLPSRATYKNTWGVVLGAFLVAVAFLVTELLRLFSQSSSVVEEVWTAEDLSSMAGSSTVAAAVGYLTSVSVRSRAFEREYDDIKAIIDGHTAETIRNALLRETDGGMADKLAKFARNTNAAATCSTVGTAGEHGLDVCLAWCQQKQHVLSWTPRKATCYMLCALATSPCTRDVAGTTTTLRTVAWGTMGMDWRGLPIRWVTSVVNWLVMGTQTLMSVILYVVVVVVVMVQEVARWGAVGAKEMTWETAWTATKMVVLLKVGHVLLTKTRAAKSRKCEMEQTLKVAQRELDKLKFDRMFETRMMLLNEEGQHSLHHLGAWVIDRGSTDGGQR